MHGLAHFQHHEVGDIYHNTDAAQSAEGQIALHPLGRLVIADIVDAVGCITGAEFRRFHTDLEAFEFIIRAFVIGGGHLQGLVQGSRHFSGHAENGIAVRTVGRQGDIKDIIIEADHLRNGCAVDAVFGQVQQAIDFGTGEQVLIESQFFTGAEHAVGHMALHFTCLDMDAAGQGGVVQGRDRLHALIYIGGAGADLDVFAVFARVDLAQEEMGPFLGHALGHFADHDTVEITCQVDQFLYFKAAAEQDVLKLPGAAVYIYIFFQPAERYSHDLIPPI